MTGLAPGAGFVPHPDRPHTLLIGAGAAIPAMVAFAEHLHRQAGMEWKPLVLLGSEVPFPFRARPSTILVPGIPEGAIACVPALEDSGIASRLATTADYPGCYDGPVTGLAEAWLSSLDARTLGEVEMFVSGPDAMSAAAAKVAEKFGVPCQTTVADR